MPMGRATHRTSSSLEQETNIFKTILVNFKQFFCLSAVNGEQKQLALGLLKMCVKGIVAREFFEFFFFDQSTRYGPPRHHVELFR
jgi:hypothetical protein